MYYSAIYKKSAFDPCFSHHVFIGFPASIVSMVKLRKTSIVYYSATYKKPTFDPCFVLEQKKVPGRVWLHHCIERHKLFRKGKPRARGGKDPLAAPMGGVSHSE